MPRQTKQQSKRRVEKRERDAALILRFSDDHFWVRVEGERAQIGLSEHGLKALGLILAAELPEIGEELERGEPFGELESKRTVQELTAPISGEVTAVNAEIDGSPALINEDPYHDGWLVEIEISNDRELDELMSAEEYDEFVEGDEPDE